MLKHKTPLARDYRSVHERLPVRRLALANGNVPHHRIGGRHDHTFCVIWWGNNDIMATALTNNLEVFV